MREIFIDTSAWDAIEDSKDPNHEIALSFAETIAGKYRLVTTNFILDETYTLLLMNVGYNCVLRFKHNIDEMSKLGVITVIHLSKLLEETAWEVFEQFNIDKKWSFTDCTSKVVMEQRKILEAFAFDHHFEQMGFIRKP
jgi:predicted nucleic acid-binding protein